MHPFRGGPKDLVDQAVAKGYKLIRSRGPAQQVQIYIGGLYFGTEDKAQAYVDFFCSARCAEPLRREDLTIEPFDEALHAQLISDNPMPSAWDAPP